MESAVIDLAETANFTLGRLRLSPALRSVSLNGETRELQPRVMQVLVALAQARPSVVSRDRLVELCWDSRIVGDDAINRCIVALRHLARDLGDAFEIQNVPRVGYRLVLPDAEAQRAAKTGLRNRLYIAIAAILLLALAGWAGWRAFDPGEKPPASIAVLPFQNLSPSDRYFAEGVGDEILDRLAREPAFRVAGRTSAAQFRDAADLREVGRSLGVDYVLEGSVRSTPGRVRVNASLVDARDGMRLWSNSYDRELKDIFAIQQAIGESVAGALKRRLLSPTTLAASSEQGNGEAYRLYLSGRAMLRTRNPQLAGEARLLMRQAIDIDSRYARAWAGLGEAVRSEASLQGHERVIAILPQARAYAGRALRLSPNLASAHGQLGGLLGHTSPEAQAHLRRAAALEPNNAEAQLWLGTARRVSGDFRGEIAAYRRAHELDPYWFRPVRDLAVATAEMGDREGAMKIAGQLAGRPLPGCNGVPARINWIFGDMAESARCWAGAANVESIWAASARVGLTNTRLTLGLSDRMPSTELIPVAELRPPGGRVWMAAAPSPSVWRQRNRSADAALVYRLQNLVAAKMMLNEGRGAELVAIYDSPAGLLGIKKGAGLTAADLPSAALAALALKGEGRAAEADAILAQASRVAAATYRLGPVPFTFDVDAAAIAAVQGRDNDAIAALQRARKRGWLNNGWSDLLRLNDEPAFASLKADARYQAIVSQLAAIYARERRKAITAGI